MKHDRGNAGHDEGVVIGVFLDLPVEGEFKGRPRRRVVVGPHDRIAEAHGRATSEDLDAVAPQSADHVEVHAEHRIEVHERGGSHPDEVPRSEQALLFAVPEGDEQRPPGTGRQHLQGLGKLQEPGDTGGVVIGAVVHEAEGAVAVAGVAVADMVVVGADDDDLPGEGGIAAPDEREDVPHAAERLVERAVVTGRFDIEFFQLFDDVGRRGPTAPGPCLPPFEGIVGEHMDVTGGVGRLDARLGGGEQFRGAGRGGGDDEGQNRQ